MLQQVSHIMRQALREGDWLARWGGEEFILFLHHSDRADAVAAAERIRLAIKAHPLKTSQGTGNYRQLRHRRVPGWRREYLSCAV